MIGNKQVPLINKRRQQKRGANKYTDSGKVRIVSLDVQRVYSFLDFITAGMQIEFAVRTNCLQNIALETTICHE